MGQQRWLCVAGAARGAVAGAVGFAVVGAAGVAVASAARGAACGAAGVAVAGAVGVAVVGAAGWVWGFGIQGGFKLRQHPCFHSWFASGSIGSSSVKASGAPLCWF